MKKALIALTIIASLLLMAHWPAPGSASGPIVRLGLGHLTSISGSRDLTVDRNGQVVTPQAQINTTFAAVAFDASGRVVKIAIDTAQVRVNFDKDFKVTSDLSVPVKTKVELGDGYGMKRASTIKKEWHEQIAELEKWMVGKTIDEIKAMRTKRRDASHGSVPDTPELTSSVTITIEEYVAVVEEALRTSVTVREGAVRLGLGHEASISSSKTASAQADVVIGAALFDKDGRVIRAIIDNAQTKVPYDKDGKVSVDKTALVKTKKEIGSAYGMVRASTIKKEWHEQIAELEKWMVGKTANEIMSMRTKRRDATHLLVPDVPELTSHVTVTVENYLASIAEAFKTSR